MSIESKMLERQLAAFKRDLHLLETRMTIQRQNLRRLRAEAEEHANHYHYYEDAKRVLQEQIEELQQELAAIVNLEKNGTNEMH